MLGYHLGWSSLLNFCRLTPESNRLQTIPLFGYQLGWFCLLNSFLLTTDSHRLLTSPQLGCHLDNLAEFLEGAISVSSLILLRAIAGSVSAIALMICSVWSSSVSGKGCRERKSSGSASFLPGSYFNSKSTSCMAMTHFSILGGSLAVALLNNGRSGLCAVTIVNRGASSMCEVFYYHICINVFDR